MISQLTVRNYALIDELNINFQQGLATITGETGSGKSIMIGALKLILGERADTKVLKDNGTKCIIEGVFELEQYDTTAFCKKYDLDYDPETTIRREITQAGKSRAFINDTPVTLAQLSELGGQLVDIHSQHETLLLNSSRFQARILDAFIGQQQLVRDYSEQFDQHRKLKQELAGLQEQDRQAKLDFDYYKFQLDELNAIDLKEDELKGLEEEVVNLEHAEDIKRALSNTLGGLENDRDGVMGQLSGAIQAMAAIKDLSDKYAGLHDRLNSSYIELKDIQAELEQLEEQVDIDPEAAHVIKERLSTVYTLQQKHRVTTVSELIELREVLSHKVASVASLDDRIAEAEAALRASRAEIDKLATQISRQRNDHANPLKKLVEEILASLNMQNAEITVALEPLEEPGPFGADKVQFLFRTNKGGSELPLKSIASGGELSRIMMSLKAILARSSKLPTIIFDEIDAGVSGEVASKMGEIMKEMSNTMQVIAITHLPQIAVKGDQHFKVQKEDLDEETITSVVELNDEQRIIEVAQLLSGEKVTEAAIENARNLLQA